MAISIRKQIYLVIVLAAVLCVSVVVLSSTSTQAAIRGIHAFSELNSALSRFYTTTQRMDTVARDWMYTGSDEKYAEYTELMDEARQELQRIGDGTNQQLTWRMGRLGNMLDYYQKPIDGYIAGEIPMYQAYNQLVYRSKLIRNTATDFYGYLSEYLESNAEEVEAQWQQKWVIQLASLSVLLLAGLGISSIYGKSILRPIQTMMRNARRIQSGNFELQPIGRASSELTIMAETFAEMAKKVQQNINVLKKNAELEQALLRQERERLVMQNLITQAELRTLQAQINPHFLFNTLSMISKSAYLHQDETTSELIDRLAEFLRYALDKSNTTATLEEEIHSIHNYLFIQRQRFGDRLDFVIDVPDTMPLLHMPAIILQPLVENAIKHGIDAMTTEAVISLKVRQRQRQIMIQIEDNGVGMSAEVLEHLQSCLRLGLESSGNAHGAGIGLTNVYRRLQMYFGKEMQFTVESEEGCGTLITICLPVEEEL